MKAVETPVLVRAENYGFYRLNGELMLCVETLELLWHLHGAECISLRLAGRASAQSIAVQFRPTTRQGTKFLLPDQRDWGDFDWNADNWLEENVPAITRLLDCHSNQRDIITLHVTLYIHDSE